MDAMTTGIGRRYTWAAAALVFLSALTWSHAGRALSPGKSISQFAVDTWTTDDGLPELAIQAILETSDGYLWVGTQEGLARFDGANFTVFDHVNTPALRSDFISTLVEDRDHTLWIGTGDGLLKRRRDGTFESFAAAELPISRIVAATLDPDGSVWVGGMGGLAHIVDGKVARLFDASDGLSNEVVTSLAIDRDGMLWIIDRGHLYKLINRKVEKAAASDEIGPRRANALFINRSGDLWILTSGDGVLRRDGDHFERWWPQGVPRSSRIRDIHEDRDGNVWVATEASGLFRSWQQLLSETTAEQGFDDLGVQRLYEDSAGNLWIGTLGRGLLRLRDGIFTAFTKKEGLSTDTVFSVLQDRAGDVWAGTLDGLTRISLDEIHRLSSATGLSSSYISSLAEDPDGGIWVGLGGTMLNHLSDGKVDRSIRLWPPQGSSSVTAVLEDRERRLWAATDGGGIARDTFGDIVYFTTEQGLPDNFVSAIAEDPRGDIWIGTARGLGRVTTPFTIDPDPLHDEALRTTGILCLYVDRRGVLWIGTMGRGLVRYDRGRLTRYTIAEGLPNETINSILADDNDDIWLGSNRGIFKIRRAALDDIADGRGKHLDVLRFGQADGMKSAETSTGAQPGASRGSDGRLWFATVQGVVVVDPAHVQRNDHPLRTYIESIRANDAPIAVRDDMASLPAGTSRLEIHYTAPDLSAAETTRFRYRLDGVDTQWIDVAAERVARYANVPPGSHRFEVQAHRDNEPWSATSTGIALHVAPLFYQTWWFLICCAMVFVVLLSLFHHLRVKWLHMQSAVADERRRIAGEIHDSLAQGFSAISVQIEAALGRLDRAPDLAVSHLKLARDVSRTSLSEARRSVWNLQAPTSDCSLVAAISAACEQIAYGHGVTLTADAIGNPWPVNPAAENHLLRIAQEAVSNAIHHGAPTEIHIEAMYTFNQLVLSIADDGRGFDAAAKTSGVDRGFGLTSMQRRAEAMNGRLDVASAAGVGTRVSVRVPRVSLLNRIWRELTVAPSRRAR
ncbi:MAG: two-component regulator propeller domain-containing protein [Rudaea sp.]